MRSDLLYLKTRSILPLVFWATTICVLTHICKYMYVCYKSKRCSPSTVKSKKLQPQGKYPYPNSKTQGKYPNPNFKSKTPTPRLTKLEQCRVKAAISRRSFSIILARLFHLFHFAGGWFRQFNLLPPLFVASHDQTRSVFACY